MIVIKLLWIILHYSLYTSYTKKYDFPNLAQGVKFPDTSNLTFVMLDEFFPMLPSHKNSFCHYISLFYVSVLGIKEENVLKFDYVKSVDLVDIQ